MTTYSSRPSMSFFRIIFILCAFIGVQSAHANGAMDDYITIKNSNTKVLQFFELVEQQTSYIFAYDEYEIDLSQELKLLTGKRLLKDLLDAVSKQTNLQFNQKEKTILVIGKKTFLQKVAADNIFGPVKGVVKDAAGSPLAGATVSVKGSTISVRTDEGGNFSFSSIAENSVLIISHVGYKTQEVAVNGQTLLQISIEEDSKGLNEVIVVGYQTRRRGDLSGALSVVNVEGISKLPVLSVDQALEGKVPGVRITQNTGQPGDGVVVRIRGVGTINDNNPLFIIDGVPTKDGINFLSANDIESMVVLKDASSAAIYGSRAANGVVLITTKSGRKGKPQF